MVHVSETGRPTKSHSFFDLEVSSQEVASQSRTLEDVTEAIPCLPDKEIDLIEYATSGDFDFADFGLQSLSLNDSETDHTETDLNGHKKKRSRLEGVSSTNYLNHLRED